MKAFLIKIAAVFWVTGVLVAWSHLVDFEQAPGDSGSTPLSWPRESTIRISNTKLTLVAFLHPRCGCSLATIEALLHVATYVPDKIAFHVRFFAPSGASNDWSETSSWDEAKRIPDADLALDFDGAEARLFGATTSGFVTLFDADHKLLFRGGITESRGHIGSSIGQRAIIGAAISGRTDTKEAPTFGCHLTDAPSSMGRS